MNRRDFLSTAGIAISSLILPRLAIGQEKPKYKPNIIFILADDLGWAELGCYGNEFNETANLDKMASQGMKFTQAYAAAPVCSPYRAALLTGQYPARVGIVDYLRSNQGNHLSTDHITFAEMLQKGGYSTGLVGKWRLGDGEKYGGPLAHGFDFEFHRGHFWHFAPNGKYVTDELTDEALNFIDQHKSGPFLLYLSLRAPHSYVLGKSELIEKYIRKPKPEAYKWDPYKDTNRSMKQRYVRPQLAAMIESIDQNVGRITQKLRALDIAEDTMLVFTSDNGGEDWMTSNAPLRCGKSTLYEGGIRVPLIVRWPKVVPANTICDAPTSNIDFYPTFLEAANIEPDPRQHLDGVSIVPLLKKPQERLKRHNFYWHYPLEKPHFLGGRSSGAIRYGDWKLIEFFDTGEVELYNLVNDISEKNNLAEKMPEKITKLQKLLAIWRKDVRA